MKPGVLALFAACCVFFPNCAIADGTFIPPTAFAKVQIPDQRALINYAYGTETLVIDTSFKGDGTNFAWIIPVPSKPTVQAATTGLFPTLQALFQPKIIHYIPKFYWYTFVLLLILSSFIWARRRGTRWTEVLAFWGIILILAAMLLPALATAGVSASPIGQVNLVERKTVGVYDTAVVSSPDGKAILDWLNTNGFVTPTNVVPAISDYAREGWYFVASKVRPEASSTEPAEAHPLALAFKTEHPVYPLRLTAIGNPTCKIDLYVFGPNQATLPDFAVERCARPSYPKPKADEFYSGYDVVTIVHPLLRALVDQSPVATKLTAQLTTDQMQKDAYISWAPFVEKRLTFYSAYGAGLFATNVSVSCMFGTLFIWYLFAASEGRLAQTFRITALLLTLASIIAWKPIRLSLPVIPVSVASRPNMRMLMQNKNDIPESLEIEARDLTNGASMPVKPDLQWVRQQLRVGSSFRNGPGLIQTNLFTGQPWHEEDSPGNYILRQTADGIDYLWYDMDGAEHTLPLFRQVKE